MTSPIKLSGVGIGYDIGHGGSFAFATFDHSIKFWPMGMVQEVYDVDVHMRDLKYPDCEVVKRDDRPKGSGLRGGQKCQKGIPQRMEGWIG